MSPAAGRGLHRRWRRLDVAGGWLEASQRIDFDAEPVAGVPTIAVFLLRKVRIHTVAVLRANETNNLHSLAVQMRPVVECAGQVVFFLQLVDCAGAADGVGAGDTKSSIASAGRLFSTRRASSPGGGQALSSRPVGPGHAVPESALAYDVARVAGVVAELAPELRHSASSRRHSVAVSQIVRPVRVTRHFVRSSSRSPTWNGATRACRRSARATRAASSAGENGLTT